MAIPDTKAFEDTLSSLTLRIPEANGEFESVVVIPASDPRLAHPVSRSYVETRLWARSGTGLTLDALIRKVESELRNKGHAATREVVVACLAVFARIRKQSKGAVAQFNDVLSGAIDSDVSQWLVLSGEAPPMQTRRLGPFKIGKLDAETLSYRMKRAGCDFFERRGMSLAGRFTVERDPFVVRLLPLASLCAKVPGTEFLPPNAGYLLLDNYFHVTADSLFENFLRTFEHAQTLRVALGYGYANIRQVALVGGETVTLFRTVGEGRLGWGCPNISIPSADVGTLDEALPASTEFLSRFGIGAFGASSLDATLRTIASFRTRAARRQTSDDADEALLNHVIALDLLFGEKDASTRTVSTRTAAIVFKAFGRSFAAQKKLIEELYDVRSKFVHQGRSVDSRSLENAEQVTLEVFYCLLRLNRNEGNHSDDFRGRWLRNLDVIVALLEAGREPSLDEMRDCGIEMTSEDRIRPVFDFREKTVN